MAHRQKQITISPTTTDADGIFTSVDLGAAGDHLISGALSTGYDPDGLVTSVTPAAGGEQTLAMDGAVAMGTTLGKANQDYGQYILFVCAGNETARTLTVKGKNKRGDAIRETITGVNAGTAIGTTLFWWITSITIDDDTAGAITVGLQGFVSLSQAQHVTLTSVADASGVTFTVSGQDRNGEALSEAVTGANADLVASTGNFSLIQRITASADALGAMTGGVNGTCESAWIPINHYDFASLSVSVDFEDSGAMTYTLQHTYDNPFLSSFDEDDASPVADATMANETAASIVGLTAPVMALRLAITAHTAGDAVMRVVPGAA